MKLLWTKKDSDLAIKEGWNLYESQGSEDGDLQVQRNDENGLLRDDLDAWRIVKTQKLQHHKKAMSMLEARNINEYNRILNCI